MDFWGLGDPKGEKRNEKSAVMRKVEKRRDVREEDVAMEKRPRFVETGPHGGTWFGETDAFVSFCPSDPHELERYDRVGVRLLSGGSGFERSGGEGVRKRLYFVETGREPGRVFGKTDAFVSFCFVRSTRTSRSVAIVIDRIGGISSPSGRRR